jgi:hypothetical protein
VVHGDIVGAMLCAPSAGKFNSPLRCSAKYRHERNSIEAEQVLANITAQTIRRLAQTIHDIQITVPKSQVVFHQPIAVIQFNPD